MRQWRETRYGNEDLDHNENEDIDEVVEMEEADEAEIQRVNRAIEKIQHAPEQINTHIYSVSSTSSQPKWMAQQWQEIRAKAGLLDETGEGASVDEQDFWVTAESKEEDDRVKKKYRFESVEHPIQWDLTNQSFIDFIKFYDLFYQEFVSPITDPQSDVKLNYVEFFARYFRFWDLESRCIKGFSYEDVDQRSKEFLGQMQVFENGIKMYKLHKKWTSRKKTYREEMTTMRNLMWAGMSFLHLIGYVQNQSGTFNAANNVTFQNSELLKQWIGGKLVH